MSSTNEDKAADVLGPLLNASATHSTESIKVIDITAASAPHDILGSKEDGTDNAGKLPKARNRIIKLNAEVDTYYGWSDDAAAVVLETASEATNETQQCDRLWAGQPVHEKPRGRYLIIKGVTTGKLRISLASP